MRGLDDLVRAFDERIADGFLYGDFQFAIDPAATTSCARRLLLLPPGGDSTPIPDGQKALAARTGRSCCSSPTPTRRARSSIRGALPRRLPARSTWSDAHQLGYYVDGYHAHSTRDGRRSGDRDDHRGVRAARRLADFMAEVARRFRDDGVAVIYGTVRLIERDEESFLAWAREPWACMIFNLHWRTRADGLAHSAAAFRRLIDLAIARGGSYFLTYHRWATAEQLEACYPQFREFLRAKLEPRPGRALPERLVPALSRCACLAASGGHPARGRAGAPGPRPACSPATRTPRVEQLVIDGVPVEVVRPAGGDRGRPGFSSTAPIRCAAKSPSSRPLTRPRPRRLPGPRAGRAGLGDGTITIRTLEATAAVTAAAVDREDVAGGRVALIGASTGAALALLTAARPISPTGSRSSPRSRRSPICPG